MNRSYTKAWNMLYSSKEEDGDQINSEQIRFQRTNRRRASEPSVRPGECPQGSLRVGMLFEVRFTCPTLRSECG